MSKGFPPHQEQDRLPNKLVWRSAAIGVALLLVCVGASWALLRAQSILQSHAQSRPPSSARPSAIGILEPGLIRSTERGRDVETQQRASLDRYGWVDRDRGIAKIPIARAIDIVLDASPARTSGEAASPSLPADGGP